MNGGTLMETAGIDRYRGTTVLGVQVEVDDYPNPIRRDDRPTTRSRTPGPSIPPNGNSTMSATKSKSTTKRSSSSSRHRKASTSARDYDEELIDVLQELRKAKTRRSADLLASLPFEVRVLDESAVAVADEFGIRRGASSGGSANESLARSGSSSTGTSSSGEGGRQRTLSSATSSSTHASVAQHPDSQPPPGHRRHRSQSQSQSHSFSNTRTGSGSDPRSTSSNSYGNPREREPPFSTSLLLQQLTTLTTRLDHETSRADSAEGRASEYLSKIKSLHTNQMQVQQELSVVRQELGLYKIQLELAQKEILRAQEIVNTVDLQRVQAEEEATRHRDKLRKLHEERIMKEALEEGRRAGYREGLEQGKLWASVYGTSTNGGSRAARSRTTSDEAEAVHRERGGEAAGERRPGRSRSNTLGTTSTSNTRAPERDARELRKDEIIIRPSTASGIRPVNGGSTRSKTPAPTPGPSNPRQPNWMSIAREREAATTPAIPGGHVPDAGYFRSQLPIPTLTTPAPISVPSTQPQPPSSRSESKHAPASLHGTTHPAPHTIRLHHPEVKIPPDGFIPTFDPVDKSISIPPPHELGRFVVPVEVDEEEAKYGPEVFTSSKSKGKTPMRGDGTKEYDMQAPSPKMDSKNGYPASAARPPTSHRDTKEVLPRYIPPQPKAVGETDYFDYDPAHDHAIELGNMTGWTNVTDLLESSTPRTRRQIAESMKDGAESIWSFGPPSTRISQYELVATPRSPRSVIGSRAAAGGDSTDARGLTSPDDDNDDAGSESFGFDFLAYNKRRRERQAQTATQTINSPTPVPRKGAGAVTQPQELAADWRSRNGYGQTSVTTDATREYGDTTYASNNTQAMGLSDKAMSIRNGRGVERSKMVDPHDINALARPISPRLREGGGSTLSRQLYLQNEQHTPNREIDSANGYGHAKRGSKVPFYSARATDYLETPPKPTRRAPMSRTTTQGTNPEIDVEPPSQSSSMVSEGKTFIDPVLLTPDGMPQPTARQQRRDDDQERPSYQPHDSHFVGYYMAPPQPTFQFSGRGYEVQPTMDHDYNFGDKPPGQVIPLSPIPSLSNLRRSELDGQSPIDSHGLAEWRARTQVQAPDVKQSSQVTNVGNSQGGFFSPRLDRPFSLFSDM